VASGGAASEAGIKAGDVILKVKDVHVNSTPELQEQVGQHRPGDQISITVLRGEKEKQVLLTLRNIEGKTDMVKPEGNVELHGAKLKSLSSSEASKLRIKGGIQVIELNNGKFKDAGIKTGFIITAVNRQAVFSVQDLQMILKDLQGGIYIEGIYPNGISAYYAFGI
jgi:S1-C subfamily serine protease